MFWISVQGQREERKEGKVVSRKPVYIQTTVEKRWMKMSDTGGKKERKMDKKKEEEEC